MCVVDPNRTLTFRCFHLGLEIGGLDMEITFWL